MYRLAVNGLAGHSLLPAFLVWCFLAAAVGGRLFKHGIQPLDHGCLRHIGQGGGTKLFLQGRHRFLQDSVGHAAVGRPLHGGYLLAFMHQRMQDVLAVFLTQIGLTEVGQVAQPRQAVGDQHLYLVDGLGDAQVAFAGTEQHLATKRHGMAHAGSAKQPDMAGQLADQGDESLPVFIPAFPGQRPDAAQTPFDPFQQNLFGQRQGTAFHQGIELFQAAFAVPRDRTVAGGQLHQHGEGDGRFLLATKQFVDGLGAVEDFGDHLVQVGFGFL